MFHWVLYETIWSDVGCYSMPKGGARPVEVTIHWKWMPNGGDHLTGLLLNGGDHPMEVIGQWIWPPNGGHWPMNVTTQWRLLANECDHPMEVTRQWMCPPNGGYWPMNVTTRWRLLADECDHPMEVTGQWMWPPDGGCWPMNVTTQWRLLANECDHPMEVTGQWMWPPDGGHWPMNVTTRWRLLANECDHPMEVAGLWRCLPNGGDDKKLDVLLNLPSWDAVYVRSNPWCLTELSVAKVMRAALLLMNTGLGTVWSHNVAAMLVLSAVPFEIYWKWGGKLTTMVTGVSSISSAFWILN